jgi:hypothetical protein
VEFIIVIVRLSSRSEVRERLGKWWELADRKDIIEEPVHYCWVINPYCTFFDLTKFAEFNLSNV